jgi:ABC-type spermidine/putrescine transport system permease subunit II
MPRRLPSLIALFATLVFVFLYAPIVVVFVNSFNADPLLIGWGGFTLDWYQTAFDNERVRADFVASVQIALLSAALSLAIAVTASLWARRASRRARKLFDATTYMRIVLPEVVLAIALFIFLRRLDLQLGLWSIVVGHVVFNSAYATVVIQARMATLTTTLEDAAADLGSPPRRVFQRVTLPLLMPAIIVAGLLTLTFSFDDVVTSLFLGGAETETLPVLLLGMIRLRVTPEVNAIGAGVMLITMVSFALAVAVATIRTSTGVRGAAVETAGATRKEER